MIKISLLYVEAGHGHRKVAEAIAEELKSSGSEFQIEIQDALEKTNPLFKKSYPQIYYQMVMRAPWLWGFFYYFINLRFVYFLISPLRTIWNWLHSKRLREYVINGHFDYILFTHFFPAEVCATLKRKGKLHSSLITVVTDVIPHAVWQNPGTDFYWVMAEKSIPPLLKTGINRDKIYPNGIPISSKFTETKDVQSLQNQFGLKQNRLTTLFTSGSFGIGPIEKVLDSFGSLSDQIQAIVVCGKNRVLHDHLSNRRFPFTVSLFGFVDNMDEIMSVTDLMIAKPGGATMCEGLVKGIPMIIMSPIPGQETYNAQWLLEEKAAFRLKNPEDIKALVSDILNHPEILESARRAIRRIAKPNAGKDLVDFILSQSKS